MTIDSYSARVIREWYTHIGGAPTRLQASTRYIDYGNFNVVCPPSIKANKERYLEFIKTIRRIKDAVMSLESMGVPREDTAMLLPLGMETKIVDKRNLRNLIDMSHQRMCSRAYWEYRQLFNDVIVALSEYSKQWKYIVEHYFVPKCKYMGFCKENKSCGMMPRKNLMGDKH